MNGVCHRRPLDGVARVGLGGSAHFYLISQFESRFRLFNLHFKLRSLVFLYTDFLAEGVVSVFDWGRTDSEIAGIACCGNLKLTSAGTELVGSQRVGGDSLIIVVHQFEGDFFGG